MNPREGRSFTQRDLFGGHGTVIVRDLLAGSPCPPFDAALACELEAGGSVGPHRQADCPELVLILSGEGTASIGDHEHTLVPGTTLYLPLGEVLSLRNTSLTDGLHYLIVKARK